LDAIFYWEWNMIVLVCSQIELQCNHLHYIGERRASWEFVVENNLQVIGQRQRRRHTDIMIRGRAINIF